MKILIATDCYIYNIGGITASVLALAKGLRLLGHEVKTLSPSVDYKSFRDKDDYFIRSVPAFYYPGMRFVFAMHDPLIKELEAWEPDIIHVQTEGSSYAMAKKIMKYCHVPLVMTCHTDYAHFIFGRLKTFAPVKALMCGLGSILYRHAVRVIAPSYKAKNFSFLHAVQDRLTVVPNGMELEKYQKTLSVSERSAFRRSLGINEKTKVMVVVSRLSKEKNIQEIIGFLHSLLEKLPDLLLLVVGDGPYRKHLEKSVKKRGLDRRVIFTGRIPAAEVWRYYQAGDVFVSASTFEVHSMCYLEALAQGLPLLCRADDALLGVLTHLDNGMIYHSKEEFSDFAYRILSDDSIREKMKNRSRSKAEDFSEDAFAAAVIRVYEAAILEEKRSLPQ